MNYYHTNDEIDEIGEGLLRKYNYKAFIQGDGDRMLIGTLSEHFQVSYKSMFYRLRDLNLFAPKEIDEYIDSSLSGLGGVQ